MFRKADFRLVAAILLLAVVALAFGQWLIAEPPIALSSDISPLNPRLFPSLVLVGIVVVAGFFIAHRVKGTDEFEAEVEPAQASPALEAIAVAGQEHVQVVATCEQAECFI